MSKDLIRQLLEAGVHFGHRTKKWNPKMKRYIHGEKNGIYIVDLEKTARCLEKAREYLKKVVADRGDVLFVGTKPQAQEAIRDAATRTGMSYVNNRWLGGTLTNFETIRKSVTRYEKLTQMREDGTFDKLTKKEVSVLTKEMTKFEKNFSGIAQMKRLPEIIIAIDATHEKIAIQEANRLNIPVVALVDTNSDPEKVLYPIPGNDDAIRSIILITNLLVESITEGKGQRRGSDRDLENAVASKSSARLQPQSV